MTAKSDRVQVALYVPPGVREVIALARGILAGMAASPGWFPSPHPLLEDFAAHIAELEAAEVLARTLVIGAVDVRDAKLRIVRNDLTMLKAYVQTAADSDRTNARAIVAASGMSAQEPRCWIKPDLGVKQGAEPGTVVLAAKSAGPRATYYWQQSANEQTWVDLPDTLQARTTVAGLAVPMTYYFRSRSLTKLGKSDWGPVVRMMVV